MGSIFHLKSEGKKRKGCWRFEDKQKHYRVTFNEQFASEFKRLFEVGEITLSVKELIDRFIQLHQESGALQDCPLVEQYAENYIAEKKRDYVDKVDKPRPALNIKRRERSLRNNLKNFRQMFGSKRLNEITAEDIKYYYRKRRERVSLGTAHTEISAIKSMFNHASRFQKFVGKNPVSQAGIRQPDIKRERVLSREEEERLLEHADPTMRDLILLLIYTGCRRDEILSLQWEWIDFNSGKIHLPANFTKNGKKRDAEINAISKTVLSERKELTGDSKFVFPSESNSGHLVRPYHAWRKLLKKAEIHDLKIHDLRHTTGTRLAELNVHPAAIQKYLGHTNYKTTQRYVHVDDTLKESGNVLSITYYQEKKSANVS